MNINSAMSDDTKPMSIFRRKALLGPSWVSWMVGPFGMAELIGLLSRDKLTAGIDLPVVYYVSGKVIFPESLFGHDHDDSNANLGC
jgi:hypothetical protein